MVFYSLTCPPDGQLNSQSCSSRGLTPVTEAAPIIVRWLNAKFRLDRDKSDKSMKFGTQLAYTLLKDIRRGAQVKLLIFSF